MRRRFVPSHCQEKLQQRHRDTEQERLQRKRSRREKREAEVTKRKVAKSTPSMPSPKAPHGATSGPTRGPKATTSSDCNIRCYRCRGLGHIAGQCPDKRSKIMLATGEVAAGNEGEEGRREKEKKMKDSTREEGSGVSPRTEVIIEEPLRSEPRMPKHTKDVESELKQVGTDLEEKIAPPANAIPISMMAVSAPDKREQEEQRENEVKELELVPTRHPKPYRLQEFKDGGEERVDEQVLPTLQTESYEETASCAVAPMDFTQILLERP